jgi:oxaloacetate decarboxylase alpha subunit
MAAIEFLDETMRDGQQSLWGMRMRAGMALPIVPTIDKVGFCVVDLTGSSMFEVLIRHCQENPWEGLDLLIEAMPNSKVRAGMRSNAAVTFGVTPDALMDVWMRQLCRHGIKSVWIYDVLFNIDKTCRLAKIAKEYDAEVAGAIMFTLSPVHTDDYYADKAEKLAACPDIDTLLLYDTAGVLGPDRLKTLVPAITLKADGKPIEFHSNNILGVSAIAYLEAIKLGVTILHTASRPMANGPSVPSTEIMVRNIEILGHTHHLDTSLLPPIAEHFQRTAEAAGYPTGVPNEYDLFSVEHQIPGGMVGTFKAQLDQHGMPEKLDEVLQETAIVRRELGYPGMATPFSQLVGTLAVLNVVTGKRYSVIPDEVIQYAAGYYGETVAPIDPSVLDIIMSSARAKEVLASPPAQPGIEDLRKEYGTGDDDDELILRALVPEADLQKMRAAGPVKRTFPTLSSPELEYARKLIAGTGAKFLEIETADLSLSLRRNG